MRPSTPSLPPPPNQTRIALVLSGVLLLALVAAIWGGVSLYRRFSKVETPVAESEDPLAVAVPDAHPVATEQSEREAAERAMALRYTPGPHVRVVGMLPGGTASLALQGMRGGARTVDTPWVVAGAELRGTNAPPPTMSTAGLALAEAAELTVIPGSPALVDVSVPGGVEADVTAVLVRFGEYPGHFFLPLTVDSELGPVRVAGAESLQVQFAIAAAQHENGLPVSDGKDLFTYIELAAVDGQGRISNYVRRDIHVRSLGTGQLEVTLSMDQATDLDLYVQQPSGAVVYYGDTTAGGAHLDLDANASCASNMGVNTEHIYWSEGRAAPGRYEVRVANWENCVQGRTVKYRITVRNCGETATFEGKFEGQGSGGDCRQAPSPAEVNACQDVVRFDVTPCPATSP